MKRFNTAAILLLFVVWVSVCGSAQSSDDAFRPSLYAELPSNCSIPDGLTLNEKTGVVYLVCPNYLPIDENGKKVNPATLMAIQPDGTLSPLMTFAPDEKSGDCSPMGIDLGPDGHLYVADNQFTGKPDAVKSRILRVELDKDGKPTGVVKTVVTGINLANGLLWDEGWLYVTDPVIPQKEGENLHGKGGLWRFSSGEVCENGPTITVDVNGDPHLIATMPVTKTRRGDIGGLDGITKAWGALWVGNVGDGALFSVTFENGNVRVKKEYQDPDFRCCDGMFYDQATDRIYINDPEDNCVRTFNRFRKMATLWQSPDNDGTNGQLDEPSECLVRDGKMIVCNFDRPFPGLVNTKHDKPYTLSEINLNQAQLAVSINGQPVEPGAGSATGTWFYHAGQTQVLVLGSTRIVLDVAAGDTVEFNLPLFDGGKRAFTAAARTTRTLDKIAYPVVVKRAAPTNKPVACAPDLSDFLQQALIEHDWRMEDGIETAREARTYRQAVEKWLSNPKLPDLARFTEKAQALRDKSDSIDSDWEPLWRELRQAKRAALIGNPIFNVGELLFVKHVPSAMSHQLTQTYGYTARPGGGLFVLKHPGKSFQTRQLASGAFPAGNFMKTEVSPDGKTLYTAFCACDTAPSRWPDPELMVRRYQIYSLNADGSGVKQLTSGDADSFAPVVSPTGEIIYLSTLRGTFHRCGTGPCYLYTLTLMDAAGGNIRPISFHETNEWDPTVLDNGRILYTRWDYVDRNAVHYQNLWQTRLDGADVRIFYGNNTFVPCGIWESRQVPGSGKVMAIGGPHHGLSAGSVILVDPTRGVDGPGPIERITPDVLYPETEAPMAGGNGYIDFDSPVNRSWYSGMPGERLPISEGEKRWPGQTFKAPFPLSEDYFIASYSYDRLWGELCANTPNMYGLYFCDRWGNRELIYRDPNISSLWAVPMTPAPRRIYNDFKPYVVSDAVPPVVDQWKAPKDVFGTMLMQNVYDANPSFPEGTSIKALRIVQVLPKSTPHFNNPMVGHANASPGKQILGTVPVESDGSAYFQLPACTPVLFQALDEQGRAIQTMRSLTYIQPGENANCIGCHEDRMKTPVPTARQSLAARRAPSIIQPGPDGSKPFSYVRLVQPVLDKHCVRCHNADKPNGIVLTGEKDGAFTKSYNQLRPYVVYSAWWNPNNNLEPLTPVKGVGTFASRLTQYIEGGHENVQLTPEERERLYIWMDGANSLFYGTFNYADQKRQQDGELIEGPDRE